MENLATTLLSLGVAIVAGLGLILAAFTGGKKAGRDEAQLDLFESERKARDESSDKARRASDARRNSGRMSDDGYWID